MKNILNVLVFVCSLMGVLSSSAAILSTDYGKVVWLENGWFGEGVAFSMTIQASNSTCSGSKFDFSLTSDHPAYKEMVSILLMAYSSDAKVRIIYDPATCVFGNRTRVTAINVSK